MNVEQLDIDGGSVPFPPQPPAGIKSDYFQLDVATWAERNFGKARDSSLLLLGAMEELGEVCRVVLKREQGIRFTKAEAKAAIRDEIGDVLVYLANFCQAEGISMEQAVNAKWAKVRERDWRADPRRGGQT